MPEVPSEQEVLEILRNPPKKIPVRFFDKNGKERNFMAKI